MTGEHDTWELYRALFESSTEAILVWEEDRLIACSGKARRWLERAETDIIGQTWLDISASVQADGRSSAEVWSREREAASTGTMRRFAWRFARPDGGWLDAQIDLRRIEVGECSLFQMTVQPALDRNALSGTMDDIQRSILDVAPTAILITSLPDGLVKYVNREFCLLSGYEVHEIINRRSPDLYYNPEDRQTLFSLIQSQGSVSNYELKGKRQDGSPMWVLLSAQSIWFEGAPALLTSFIDITARKDAEEMLRRSEERFRDMVTSVIGWVWEVDAQGRYTFCSDRVYEILGYTAQEMLGKTPFDMMLPEEAARIAPLFGEMAAAQKPIIDLENWNRHRDGHHVCLLTNGVPVLDAAGNLAGYRGVDADITGRVKLERDRQDAESHLRNVLDALPMGMHMYRLEADGRLVFSGANAAADRLLGVDNRIFVGKAIEEAFPPLMQTEVPARYREAADQGVPWQTRQIAYDEGQIQGAFEVYAFQTGPGSMAAAFLDVTERVRAEQLQAETYQRREREVRTSTEVAQEIAAAPALDALFERVVTLVKERFGYYHAQIFHYDPDQEAVVLVVGYGEVGQRMLAAGHRLVLGRGVVGTAAATGEPVLATDVTQSAEWRPNPNLPNTRGELAVPIKWRGQILGILDVQSDRASALGADDQLLLEGLCGQIAIAIENTRLLSETGAQQRLLQAVLDNTPLGVFVVEAPTGRPILVNRRSEEMLGKGVSPQATKDELAEVYAAYVYGTDELYPPERMPLVRGMFGESASVDDMEIRRSDGQRMALQIHGAPIRDENGQITSSVAVFEDITGRKQVQERIEAEVRQRTAELQQERDRAQRYLNVAGTIIVALNARGEVTVVNRSVRDILGYQPDELIGQNWFDVTVPGEIRDVVKGVFGQLMKGEIEQTEYYENEIATKTGEVRVIAWHNSLLRDETGQIVGTLSAGQDITERKRAEAELAVQQEHQRVILETVPTGVSISRLQDGLVLFANPGFAAIAGRSLDEIVGRPAPDLYYNPDDRKTFVGLIQQSGRVEGFELQARRADGSLFWVMISARIIKMDSTPVILSSLLDITERKRTEEMIRESERQYRDLLNSLRDGFAIVGLDGRVSDCNPTFEQMTGYSLEELKRITFGDLTPPRWHDMEAQILQEQALMRGYTDLYEKEYVRKDGTVFPVELTVYVARGRVGEPVGFWGFIRDISERKRIEQELRANEERLSLALESGRVGIWEFWPQSGQVYFNPTWYTMLGYEPYELPQDLGTWAALLHPDDAPRANEMVMTSVQTGQDFHLQFRMKTKDGGWRWIQAHGYVTSRTPEGSAERAIGTHTDITEQKLAEEMLRATQFSVDYAPESIFWIRQDATLAYVNQTTCDVLGYGRDELLAMTVFDVDPAFPREAWAGHWESLKQTLSLSIETQHRTRQGRIFPVAVELKYLQYGGMEYNCAFARDISVRKRIEVERERLSQRRAEQAQVSAQVSQELAGVPRLDELFRRVVNLIRGLGYYHAQIFRYDSVSDAMNLVYGYGEAGAAMLAAGHHLPMGRGVVGTAAATGESVLVTDTRQNPDWRPNPQLPLTQGELAVPIRLREQVLGVLDVQSDQVGALTDDDRILLESLSGPIALAMEASRLLEEANTFRQFADASGQGLGMATLDGQIIYINPALARILGETRPADVLGRQIAQYYADDMLTRLQNEVMPAVQQRGEWLGEMAVTSAQGRVTPTLENYFMIRDEDGVPRYIADVLTDITERKQTEAEMSERLRELNTLYRTLSRETWTAAAHKTQALVFDPATWTVSEPDAAKSLESEIVLPLRLRGESIGTVQIAEMGGEPLTAEERDLLESLLDEAGEALERARLSQQIQESLVQTQTLYDLNRSISQVRSEDELLQALVRSLGDVHIFSANLSYVQVGVADAAEWLEVVAVWRREGPLVMPVGTRFHVPDHQVLEMLRTWPDQPVLVPDVAADPRLDERSRQAQLRIGARSIAAIPLSRAGRWIGLINLNWAEPHQFSEQEKNLYAALLGIVSPVVESRQLLMAAQARARREQQLREITDRLRNQPDVDGVLRALVRELGQTVGQRAFVSLSDVGPQMPAPRT